MSEADRQDCGTCLHTPCICSEREQEEYNHFTMSVEEEQEAYELNQQECWEDQNRILDMMDLPGARK